MRRKRKWRILIISLVVCIAIALIIIPYNSDKIPFLPVKQTEVTNIEICGASLNTATPDQEKQIIKGLNSIHKYDRKELKKPNWGAKPESRAYIEIYLKGNSAIGIIRDKSGYLIISSTTSLWPTDYYVKQSDLAQIFKGLSDRD